MITLISPAKTLDFNSIAPTEAFSIPHFSKQADFLASKLKQLDTRKLAVLLQISPKLAQLNHERYANWVNAPQKQAIFAYAGDVYQGMQATTFSEKELDFAQQHLYILSGLYGLLKPLDLIKPYRIEMGTAFKTSKADTLYEFWQIQLSSQIAKRIKESNSKVLVNLASQEYFSCIDTQKLKSRIITPVFKDNNKGKYSIISFFAKQARGLMCRYIIENQITDFEMLIGFDSNGYNFNHGLSTKNNFVFTRG